MEPSLSSLVDPIPIRLKIRGRGARSRRWFGGLRLIVEPIQFLGADGAGGGAMSELPAGNSDMLGDPGVMSISPFLSAAAKLMAEVSLHTPKDLEVCLLLAWLLCLYVVGCNCDRRLRHCARC